MCGRLRSRPEGPWARRGISRAEGSELVCDPLADSFPGTAFVRPRGSALGPSQQSPELGARPGHAVGASRPSAGGQLSAHPALMAAAEWTVLSLSASCWDRSVSGGGSGPAHCHVLTGFSVVPEHEAVDYHGVPGRRLRAGPGEAWAAAVGSLPGQGQTGCRGVVPAVSPGSLGLPHCLGGLCVRSW